MDELLPTLQAEALKKALVQYVSTAVRFSEKHVERAFAAFLEDPVQGIFQGPYVRTRLPFAAREREHVLDILPEWFAPYTHQAEAFARLGTSPDLPGERDRAGLRLPEPTIVTTGTGSGKTESFLYPVLDYAVRARKAGVRGTKAIILYPMNALANDQASRLAGMIHENPALNGVTAGLYTGEGGSGSSTMTPEHLIEDRYTIRESAPDILLTNYKMLDQLLLRSEDRKLWSESSASLRYLVLDEFHTYNGAQGTDVAMLIRRLRLLLERLSDGRGHLVPVATSATLGDKKDLGAVADFAATVFGQEFPAGSVVTEERVTVQQLVDRARADLDGTGLSPVEDLGTLEAQQIIESAQLNLPSKSAAGIEAQTFHVPTTSVLVQALLDHLWTTEAGDEDTLKNALGAQRIQTLFLAHPLIQRLLEETAEATSVEQLATRVFGRIAEEQDRNLLVALLLAGLSHARADGQRNEFPNLEAHLWIREISRVDRTTSSTVSFRWSEDTTVIDDSALPAVYCRSCGASGWGTRLTGIDELVIDSHEIRQAQVQRSGKFRALMFAPQHEGRQDEGQQDPTGRLRYLNANERTLGTSVPDQDSGDVDPLPVMTWTGLEADKHSNEDDCPACEAKDSVRFVGSRTATLLSVSLSSVFGTSHLRDGEKKSLVFTDSVQDAAHRSAFVESRSYALSLRAAIQAALDTEPRTVDEVVATLMSEARTDAQRYRLLPATIVHNAPIRPYWEPEASKEAKEKARKLVAQRLRLELDLELGLIGSYGRTLSTTGAAVASVHGSAKDLERIGAQALAGLTERHLSQTDAPFAPDTRQVARWVRGILERLRMEGAISHEWFTKYREQGGGRFWIWGGRTERAAMRAFPRGASAPEFPYLGKLPESLKSGFTDAAGRRGRYARWTATCLGVDTRQAGQLMVNLLEGLVKAGYLDQIEVAHRQAGARTFGLRRDRVRVGRSQVPQTPYLVCPQCGNEVTGLAPALEELEGAPCFAMTCRGTLRPERRTANYYRDLYEGKMLRVISREHTSLLESAQRLEYETQFKQSESTPGAPNVLVATPTLEMGIDIGDLSMVMLSSIPRTVASYLQRVGRAGRLTGNALDLTYASASSHSLTSGMKPTELINGSVRPPAAYLAAEEILHRQFLAFLMDRMAGDDSVPPPNRMKPVLKSAAEGTYLGALIEDMREHAEDRLDEFVSSFEVKDLAQDGLTRDAIRRLRRWALPESGQQSGLEQTIFAAVTRWGHERDQLRYRLQAVRDKLDALDQSDGNPSEDDQETKATLEAEADVLCQHRLDLDALEPLVQEAPEEQDKEWRRLAGQRKRLGREKSELDHQHWVGALEQFGLLPNFTLFDDSVDLDVTLTWRDDGNGDGEENNKFHHMSRNYSRAGFGALTELAPGSRFYAEGIELTIDTVDLGHNQDNLRVIAFCPHCGHQTENGGQEDSMLSCPACGQPGIGDPGQSLSVVDFKKVSSSADRNLSTIGDSVDDRVKARYRTKLVPNFTAAKEVKRWSINDTGIGINHRRNTKITMLNLGRPVDSGPSITLAGQMERVTGFLICSECGHKDDDTGRNEPKEHQGWCSLRHAENAQSVSAVLARELETESVLVTLPKSIGEDSTGISLYSFASALMLGLREMFGGDIGHLAYEAIADTSRNNATALLFYDLVPGGTGYLTELAQEASLHEVLMRAKRALKSCECSESGEAACHRCLLPHLSPGHRSLAHRGRAVEVIDGILAPLPDQNPGEYNWTTEETDPPVEADIESNLEARFFRVFRNAVTLIPGADISDTVGDGGRGFSVFLDGMTYTYTQQVQLGDVQPDAMIKVPGAHGVSGVTIFLDGKSYHASPSINRVADDAEKRHRLREGGYLVYAITDQDVSRFESGGNSGKAPLTDLIRTQQIKRLIAGKAPNKWGQAESEFVVKNPIEMLLDLFDAADPFAVQRNVSRLFPAILVDSKDAAVIDDLALQQKALQALEDPARTREIFGPGKQNGIAQCPYPLFLAARLTNGKEGFPMTVVLDDRPAAVESEDFDLAWREWLALANLGQPFGEERRIFATWTSLTRSLQAETPTEDDSLFAQLMGDEGSGAPDLPPHPEIEQTLPAAYETAMGEAFDPAEKEVLRIAAASGLPVPTQAEEWSGIVVDLAWPDLKIAWIADEDSVRDASSAPGLKDWTVVGPDAQTIVDVIAHTPVEN